MRRMVMMMMVVVVTVVLDFDQRPTKRLSEAVTNLDRFDLHLVHENSDFALMTPRAMTEMLWRYMIAIWRRRHVLSIKRRKIDIRSRQTGRRRRGQKVITIGRNGWNSMTKPKTIERRVLFNRRRYNKETYGRRGSAHLSWRDSSQCVDRIKNS